MPAYKNENWSLTLHFFSGGPSQPSEPTRMACITATIADFFRQNFIVVFTLLVSVSVYSLVQYHRSPWRKVPPGPKGWPLIGNALDLGGSHLWLKFTKWRETYGTSSI